MTTGNRKKGVLALIWSGVLSILCLFGVAVRDALSDELKPLLITIKNDPTWVLGEAWRIASRPEVAWGVALILLAVALLQRRDLGQKGALKTDEAANGATNEGIQIDNDVFAKLIQNVLEVRESQNGPRDEQVQTLLNRSQILDEANKKLELQCNDQEIKYIKCKASFEFLFTLCKINRDQAPLRSRALLFRGLTTIRELLDDSVHHLGDQQKSQGAFLAGLNGGDIPKPTYLVTAYRLGVVLDMLFSLYRENRYASSLPMQCYQDKCSNPNLSNPEIAERFTKSVDHDPLAFDEIKRVFSASFKRSGTTNDASTDNPSPADTPPESPHPRS